MTNIKLSLSNKGGGKDLKEKTLIALILLVAVLVTFSMAVYLAFAGTIGYEEVASAGIIVILVAFAAYILWDKAKNKSKGLPAGDKRTKNITYKAGYYGFIAAIWSAVFAPLFVDIFFGYEMESDLVSGAVVLIGGLVFAASYLYMARKGN
jgi:membrane protease YdiL (CAAX protease family)